MSAFNNVLVIEDNPGDARLAATYLDDRLGARCAVRQAATLADGLLALRQRSADVVLLDLDLPDSQGLAGYIEVSRQAPRTPVVILTGRDDEDGALEALRIGAEDYLSKSHVDGPSLVRALRHAVQRRQLSNQLRRSDSRCQAIANTADEGILHVDRGGTVLFLNARAHQILNLSAVDPDQGLHLWDCIPVGSRRVVEELLATPVGMRLCRELNLSHGPDAERWVLVAAGGSAAPAGADPELVLLLTDISEHRRTAQTLAQLRERLEELVLERTAMLASSNEELRTLGRSMAHDLRTPLNGILGMTHLVKREAQNALSTTAWKRLLMVEQSAQDMNQLIARLLSLTALGQQEIQRVGLNLSAMAETVVRQLEASDPGRVVRWRIQPGLSARGDLALVSVVLQNLLENAWKYSSQVADATIEFGAESNTQTTAVYYVKDNGIGFDMAHASHLFHAYERLPSAAGYAGTGLGLSGVKCIVARHGGIAWAVSSPGQGATFHFTLEPQAAAN